MSHFFHLRPSSRDYGEFQRANEERVRVLQSPGNDLSVMSTTDLASPKTETQKEKIHSTDDKVKDEYKIMRAQEHLDNEDSGKKLLIKREAEEKDNDKDIKEEDKNQETFVAVIAQSILSVPTKRMTLSSIYNYIANNYPHFDKEKGPGWRNSVRHNLSSNDCFVKASRAENGKGHYWMIHPKDLPEFSKGNFRRRRKPRRPKCSHSLMFRDGPLYYHHACGVSCSSYVYPGLRSSQELTDLAYGTSTHDRSLTHNYRTRVSGFVTPFDESPSRYALSSYPYNYSTNIAIRAYPNENSLIRSPTTTYSSLTNYTSSFRPVNHHYSCDCHRWQLDSTERRPLSS